MHNPGPDADVLLDTTETLLRVIAAAAAAARRAPARSEGDRWLVLTGEGGAVPTEIYRQVCAQLSATTAFRKILIVLAGDRVETLVG